MNKIKTLLIALIACGFLYHMYCLNKKLYIVSNFDLIIKEIELENGCIKDECSVVGSLIPCRLEDFDFDNGLIVNDSNLIDTFVFTGSFYFTKYIVLFIEKNDSADIFEYTCEGRIMRPYFQ